MNEPTESSLDPALRARLTELFEEGRDIFEQFETDVRQHAFHPFIPAEYESVLPTLLSLRAPGLRFLEWGSATGVITIMADMLGFEAYGIEIDANLVKTARRLAEKYESRAQFAVGSFLPTGYEFRTSSGDRRLGTIEEGRSGYLELGHPLDYFDVVFGYPWGGEDAVMLDVMRRYSGDGARFVLHSGSPTIHVFNDSRRER